MTRWVFAVLFCPLGAPELCVNVSSTPWSTYDEILGSACAAGARGAWTPGAGPQRCLMAARTWSRNPNSAVHAGRCMPNSAEFRDQCLDFRPFNNNQPSRSEDVGRDGRTECDVGQAALGMSMAVAIFARGCPAEGKDMGAGSIAGNWLKICGSAKVGGLPVRRRINGRQYEAKALRDSLGHLAQVWHRSLPPLTSLWSSTLCRVLRSRFGSRRQ